MENLWPQQVGEKKQVVEHKLCRDIYRLCRDKASNKAKNFFTTNPDYVATKLEDKLYRDKAKEKLCCNKVLDKLCCNKVYFVATKFYFIATKFYYVATLCWASRMLTPRLKSADVVTLEC